MTELNHRRRTNDRIEERARRSREYGDRAALLISEGQLERPCDFPCDRGVRFCFEHGAPSPDRIGRTSPVDTPMGAR